MTKQQKPYGAKNRVRFQEHPEIFKVQNPDGSRYETEKGYEVKTHKLDLHSFFMDHIIHLESVAKLLEDNPNNFLYNTLIERLERQLDVMWHFFRQEIGEAYVDFTDDQIIGVSILPKNTEKKVILFRTLSLKKRVYRVYRHREPIKLSDISDAGF